MDGGAIASIAIAFAETDPGMQVPINIADPAPDDPIDVTIIVAIGVPVGLPNDIPGRVTRSERPFPAKGPIRVSGVEVSVGIVNSINVGRLVIEPVVPS